MLLLAVYTHWEGGDEKGRPQLQGEVKHTPTLPSRQHHLPPYNQPKAQLYFGPTEVPENVNCGVIPNGGKRQ